MLVIMFLFIIIIFSFKFIKFEIDESNRRTPAKFGIRGIPSVLAFRNGELIEARSGLMDEETLSDWIRELKGS